MTSGFRREVDDNRNVLAYYAASSGNSLRTFRDNLSVSSSRDKMRPKNNRGPMDCPEKSVLNCRYSLCNESEQSSYP